MMHVLFVILFSPLVVFCGVFITSVGLGRRRREVEEGDVASVGPAVSSDSDLDGGSLWRLRDGAVVNGEVELVLLL